MLHGGLEGGVDLFRIVPASTQLLDLLVGQALDHLEQPWVRAKEMFPGVGPRLDAVLLIVAVDGFFHALDQQAVHVAGQKRVPAVAPDDLDHVPAGATEGRLELLDDLAVAPHGSVQTLQIAIDDKDQVVELFTRGQRDRAESLRFVGFTVADEGPHTAGLLFQATILEIAIEAGLVDGHDRAQPHRHRGELPEVRIEPGVRVGSQPAGRSQLAPEVLQLLFGQPALEKGPGVDAGGCVALEVDLIAAVLPRGPVEEMVEGDLVECRRGGVGRDVAADAGLFAVGPNDHGHGVPADDALDPALDSSMTREAWLAALGNRVDVGRVRQIRQRDTELGGPALQRAQQITDPVLAAVLDDVVQRLEPFLLLDGVEIGLHGIVGRLGHGATRGAVPGRGPGLLS